ncbi:MAG TPA: DUF4230 domain-containing protein [Candidatus Absconditabacterales bacterium]|nr:DUF4230 domain-containing protein [Candidatus Absconditabacterales bacterium]
MKFLKVLYRILILIVIIFILLFAWRWLQKESVIITNSTKSVIAKLQSVNKLESAEMTITKIMRSEKGLVDIIPNMSIDNTIQDFLFQDKMIFEVEGRVIAGIDLSKMQTGDVFTKIDGSVKINLPEAEVLHVILDENSKPFERKIGVFTKGDVEMETMIRNKAKEEMEVEAVESGILEVAQKNAKENLEKTFEDLDIRVDFD